MKLLLKQLKEEQIDKISLLGDHTNAVVLQKLCLELKLDQNREYERHESQVNVTSESEGASGHKTLRGDETRNASKDRVNILCQLLAQ